MQRNYFEDAVLKLDGDIQVIQGVSAHTIIISQEFEDLVEKSFEHKLVKKSTGLVKFVLRSPESLEEVPGVMAYLCSLFSEN